MILGFLIFFLLVGFTFHTVFFYHIFNFFLFEYYLGFYNFHVSGSNGQVLLQDSVKKKLKLCLKIKKTIIILEG